MNAHSNPFNVIEQKIKLLLSINQSNLDELKVNELNSNDLVLALESKQPSASINLTTPKKHSDQAIEYAMWNSIEGVTELNYVALTDIGVALNGLLVNQYTVAQIGHAKYRLGTLVGDKKLLKIINSATQKSTHIKVLSQVPSISEYRAKIILDNYSMSDIITGIADENKLANIMIPFESKKTDSSNKFLIDDMSFGDELKNKQIIQTNNNLINADLINTLDFSAVNIPIIRTIPDSNSRRLGDAAAKNICKYLRDKH
jgi:hypothetical protein